MNVLVIAEQRNGTIKKASFEAMRAGATLAASSGGSAAAVVIGKGVAQAAAELGAYGAGKVYVVENDRLANYSTTAYAKAAAETARHAKADVVLLPASAMGKDLAPRIAVKLDAGYAADVTALSAEGNALKATRPVYAGKALLDVTLETPVKIATLRPNVFPAGSPDATSAPAEHLAVQFDDKDFSAVVKETAQTSQKLDVAEADIIVSGGRGMKGPEHFALLEELASVLGGAVGASRAVVDAGWRPHGDQVGQTGKTVSPALYIAVGISGAIQHLAGMSSSKYIVAINKDKDAPIFQIADYGIVGDAFEVVPALTNEFKKLLGK